MSGRALPLFVLVSLFGLGCLYSPSNLRVVNLSSQTLELNGTYTDEIRVSSVLAPKSELNMQVRDRGSFSGSVQAKDQRWSTPADWSIGFCFIDDPAQNGRILLVPIADGYRSSSIDRTMTAQLDEFIVINRSVSDVLVMVGGSSSAKLLPPGGVLRESMPREGDARFRVMWNNNERDVTLPRESDRVWIVRD
jgi:hypothetical protein